MRNVAPGAMPSFAMRAIVSGSSGSGGFVTSRRFRRLKKSSGDIASTCFGTGVLVSTPSLSGTSSGGVYGLPHDESGTNLYWSCSAWTAA